MNQRELPRRATLEDVAREAGVSLATVDRALNGREGVSDKTLARVSAAVAKLGYHPNAAAVKLARARLYRFAFVLPSTANSFFAGLEAHLASASSWIASQNAYVDIVRADVFDADALGDALDRLPALYDGVATVALDHPRVTAAIDGLVLRGTEVVTLVSDAPTSRRSHYVGINNAAAGRTAGSLMGRFLQGRTGKVAILVGSLALRDHAERYFGFNQVVAGEYPGLEVLPVIEGRDDDERNRDLTDRLLAEHPDLVGLYNGGAGNEGVAAALQAGDESRSIVWIAHELAPATRKLLVRGVADAVINQDAGHEARSAIRLLIAACSSDAFIPEQERIRIEIFVRDNLP